MDTLAEAPHSALSGVARVLVHAGKLNAKTAEELVRSSREKRTSFVASVIGAGAVSPSELAHTLSTALALPLLDLTAIDATKLPKNVIDAQARVAVPGRGARQARQPRSSSAAPTRPTRKRPSASSSRPSSRPSG